MNGIELLYLAVGIPLALAAAATASLVWDRITRRRKIYLSESDTPPWSVQQS